MKVSKLVACLAVIAGLAWAQSARALVISFTSLTSLAPGPLLEDKFASYEFWGFPVLMSHFLYGVHFDDGAWGTGPFSSIHPSCNATVVRDPQNPGCCMLDIDGRIHGVIGEFEDFYTIIAWVRCVPPSYSLNGVPFSPFGHTIEVVDTAGQHHSATTFYSPTTGWAPLVVISPLPIREFVITGVEDIGSLWLEEPPV